MFFVDVDVLTTDGTDTVLLACIGEDALEVFEGLPFASEKEES